MFQGIPLLSYIVTLFEKVGVPTLLINILIITSLLSIVIGIIYGIRKILYQFVLELIKNRIKSSRWYHVLIKYNLAHRIYFLGIGIILYWLIPMLFIQKLLLVYITIIIGLIVSSFLNISNEIYILSSNISKKKPIKSYIDVVKIINWIVVSIIFIAILIDSSPLSILTGLGAISAILLLVFKDPIMGLVSSIQLAAYDIIRIGDWIKIPSYNVNGDVLEIALNVVKIQNFDKTIVSIPTADLIKNGVINYRGMKEAGGRRIKRSIYIDISTIQFCKRPLLDQLKQKKLLHNYIQQKEQKNISSYTSSDKILPKLTNIGLFRYYTEAYLRANSNIRKDFTFLIRHLDPSIIGLPIEIYIFTNTTNWNDYECIQADIFDHLLAILPQFQLKVLQQYFPVNSSKQ